jgi:hypothetical protein
MTYTVQNFPSAKAVREALKSGPLPLYQPGPFGPSVPDGLVFLEGPHYPQPHKWYLAGIAKNNLLVSLKR